MQKHIQRNKDERRHSSLEKYTSHFIWKGSKGLLKVLLCEKWVRDWTELQYIDPTLMAITAFLSRSPVLLYRGPGGQASLGHGPHSSIFSPSDLNSNWLNFLSPELYNNLTPTLLPASVTISRSIQPVHDQSYILIFLDRMHLLFTQVHFLFWQLGRVGGQYATLSIWITKTRRYYYYTLILFDQFFCLFVFITMFHFLYPLALFLSEFLR